MKYYCIGIKGTGMSALAQILSDLGNEVSGYDDAKGHKFTEDGLNERNIPIYYDSNHPLAPDTIVTYSMAFTDEHPEMKRVKDLGLKVIKYNELMGEITTMFETIGVSGTHGKTTTTSLIKHIIETKMPCNYFIGTGHGYASLENKYYVVECDEFNHHFTAYHPTYSIITNIEAEHLECFHDIDGVRDAFTTFANNTKNLVIANGDNQEVRKIKYKSKIIFFGENANNDYLIKDINLTTSGSSFSLYYKNELLNTYTINLYGKHMVYDAAAAIILCRELGFSDTLINEALSTFHNAERRFAEESVKGTTIIDDYAHHPTEIKVTLEAIRQKYPDKRLVVVFVPNTYSRTRDFKDEFVEALKVADKAYLTEIDCNREDPNDYKGVSSKLITDNLPGSEIISIDTIENLKKEKDSIICFMSCAHIEALKTAFKNVL